MSETEKIIALIDKAVSKIHEPTIRGGPRDGEVSLGVLAEARDEMWVAASWIMRKDATDVPEILNRIFEDERRAYLFLNGVLLCFSSLEKQIEDIQDGIPWEAEGETFIALTSIEMKAQGRPFDQEAE